MQITVIALMCHALASIPQPVCREEIVVRDELSRQLSVTESVALPLGLGREA